MRREKLLLVIGVTMSLLLAGCSTSTYQDGKDAKDYYHDYINQKVEIDEDAAESHGSDMFDSTLESLEEFIDDSEHTHEKVFEDIKNDKFEKPSEFTSEGYTLIEVDGGDLSGDRLPNVMVDIGYGDREYWAYTNEYGQLIRVEAKEIIIQDEENEAVNIDGRYYDDEAKVPGVERDDLDEGHIIADSLGGVSNAYNITPQDSTLNRHGDQAYMEKVIRDAGGCTDFVCIITYPDTKTMIPSHYSYTYTLMGEVINDEFDNVNPDSVSVVEENILGGVEHIVDSKTIVYWTPKGTCYHIDESCSSLWRSKTVLSGTLKESSRTEPCEKCCY